MKRVIWVVIILSVIVYFANDHLDKKANIRIMNEAQSLKEAQNSRIIKDAFNKLVTQTNAVDNWQTVLSGVEKSYFGKITTLELEKVWLVDRPILFIGFFDDIASFDEQHYIVSINKSFMSMNLPRFELIIELKCNKEIIDTFIKKHPSVLTDYKDENVAIVGQIEEIRKRPYLAYEGECGEFKIGRGHCIDMLFIGNERL